MSSTGASHAAIAICGAGPVGTSLALLAARYWPAVTITLFDADNANSPQAATDPRALAISRSNLWLLERVLGERFAALPRADIQDVVVHAAFSSDGPNQSLRLGAQRSGGARLGAVLRYGELLAALRAAWANVCKRMPQRCKTIFGSRAELLCNDEQGVTLQTQQAPPQRFDLCLLAEGGLFGAHTPRDWHQRYEQSALVGEVDLGGAEQGVAYECFGRSGALALLPLPHSAVEPLGYAGGSANEPARYALVFCLPQSQADSFLALSPDQLNSLCSGFLPPALHVERWTLPLARFPLGLNAVARLVLRRTIVLGNAAQTLHPIAGQGLNLGLRDANALVRDLSPALAVQRSLACLADCLRRYERARSLDRAGVILATHSLAASLGRSSSFFDAARQRAFAALQWQPVRRYLASRLMFGWD